MDVEIYLLMIKRLFCFTIKIYFDYYLTLVFYPDGWNFDELHVQIKMCCDSEAKS